MQYQKLRKTAVVLLIAVLAVVIIVYAKPFLVPLAFAALLSMLLLPITKWQQKKGVPPVLSIVLSIMMLLLFCTMVIFFISWQLSDLVSDASKIEQQASLRYTQLKELIHQKTGITPQKQQQMLKEQQGASGSKASALVAGFLSGLAGFVTNAILVLVYIFLLTHYRRRFKVFMIRLVPKGQESTAMDVVNNAQQVAQKYLSGLFTMIFFLWVMYSIGFLIVGVKNPVFFAILCGLLEIVPFVGNLVGTAITLGMALVQGGGSSLIIGILITYALVQFIQTYMIEPLVVGAQVNINPLFTIVALVAGEFLWGIPGMILAIPLLGMFKIVCDHVPPLKPYGYLIGSDSKEEESGFNSKMKTAMHGLISKFKK